MARKSKIETMADKLQFQIYELDSLLRMVKRTHEPEGTEESDDVLHCMQIAERLLDGIQSGLGEIENAAKGKDADEPEAPEEAPEVTH